MILDDYYFITYLYRKFVLNETYHWIIARKDTCLYIVTTKKIFRFLFLYKKERKNLLKLS